MLVKYRNISSVYLCFLPFCGITILHIASKMLKLQKKCEKPNMLLKILLYIILSLLKELERKGIQIDIMTSVVVTLFIFMVFIFPVDFSY